MSKRDTAQEFTNALMRQVEQKRLFTDGIDYPQDPQRLIISIAEELGEVATDYLRHRIYSAVAECIDVAHSALLLAVMLDPDGEVLRKLRQHQ